MAKYIPKNGKVTGVEIGGMAFPTKKPILFKDMDTYAAAIEKVEEIIDFSKKMISQEVFDSFTEFMRNRTIDYLKLLRSEDRWFTSDELKKKLGFDKSQAIAGVRTSLTKRARKLNIDPVDTVEWILKDGRWQGKYKIKPEYRELLKKSLGIT